MVRLPSGYQRRPQSRGFLSPQSVTTVIDAGTVVLGDAKMGRVAQAAELYRIPADDEPLREEKAARLHHAVLSLYPKQGEEILRRAGVGAADLLMAHQFSSKGRALMSTAPWTVAAWLLGRWAGQHAWMFAGSGRFFVRAEMEFEIVGNPLAKTGAYDVASSFWQESLFEHLFQSLVDDRLICREMECEGKGDTSCQFAFMLADA